MFLLLREILQPPATWLGAASRGRLGNVALLGAGGLAAYGFSVGAWRSPQMGLFVAVKMPLLLALTLACNFLLNGLFGALLGGRLTFRETWVALLSASATAGMILGALSPVTWLLAWNAPGPESAAAGTAHASYLLFHTLLIAYAGIIANVRLFRLIAQAGSSGNGAELATLLAWLAGNALLGAQFSWILRPFFGTPGLAIRFLRDDPLRGNFYETVWRALRRVSSSVPLEFGWLAAVAIMAAMLIWRSCHRAKRALQTNIHPTTTKP